MEHELKFIGGILDGESRGSVEMPVDHYHESYRGQVVEELGFPLSPIVHHYKRGCYFDGPDKCIATYIYQGIVNSEETNDPASYSRRS